MAEPQLHPQGLNAKRVGESKVIGIGIQVEQFINYLRSLTPDDNGWVNLDQVEREQPAGKAGYTHFFKLSKQQLQREGITEPKQQRA